MDSVNRNGVILIFTSQYVLQWSTSAIHLFANASPQRTSKLVDRWEIVPDAGLVHRLLEDLRMSKRSKSLQLHHPPVQRCQDCAAVDLGSESMNLRRTLRDIGETSGQCVMCNFLYRRISSLGKLVHEPLRLVRVKSTIKLLGIDHEIISIYSDPSKISVLWNLTTD